MLMRVYGIAARCWDMCCGCCSFELLQYKAFILILATLVYFVEYAVTPRMMMDTATRAEATTPADGDCCHGGTHVNDMQVHDMQTKCMQATSMLGNGKRTRGAQTKTEGHCPRPSKGCSPTSDCCLNCPLCFQMLLPVSAERTGVGAVSVEYPEWTSSYVYLYFASCWKPPNMA
ncbi:MAG TPA: hypothetical protein VG605_19080 [Puia sp.]|nr:hypothetical protein [Puia sp.]